MAKPKPLPKAVAKPAKPRAAAAGKYRVLKGGTILRLADGCHIPADEANGDFRAFVAEVAADPSIVAR